jgi:hypothetical protein
MFEWLRGSREVSPLEKDDADALVSAFGPLASRVARNFGRNVGLSDGTAFQGRTPDHWRRVAILIDKTGRQRVEQKLFRRGLRI